MLDRARGSAFSPLVLIVCLGGCNAPEADAVADHTDTDLSLGHRTMQYDFFGNVQIDTIGDMLTAAIAQDPARFGANLAWVNAASNYSFGGIPVRADWAGTQQVARSPGSFDEPPAAQTNHGLEGVIHAAAGVARPRTD